MRQVFRGRFAGQDWWVSRNNEVACLFLDEKDCRYYHGLGGDDARRFMATKGTWIIPQEVVEVLPDPDRVAEERWKPSENDEPMTLDYAVRQAMAGASMCWAGSGVFDTDKAAWIAGGLTRWIQHYYDDKVLPDPDRVVGFDDKVLPDPDRVVGSRIVFTSRGEWEDVDAKVWERFRVLEHELTGLAATVATMQRKLDHRDHGVKSGGDQ